MKCRVAKAEEWDDWVSNHPEATFFHTRAWSELWENYIPRSKAKAYIFEDYNSQIAFLPGLERKMFKGLITRFDSGPEGTYGGFLFHDNQNDSFSEYTSRICKSKFSFYIRKVSPCYGLEKILPAFDKTRVLFLGNNPRSLYSKNTKRNIQKAVSHSIVIELADTEKDLSAYYRLYQQSAGRWAKKKETLYPLFFFENLYKDTRIRFKLWIARKDAHLVYGCLVFYYQKSAYYWHGCGNETGLETGAAFLLHDHIIADAKLNGFTYYDFMPNGGNQSLDQFKSGFGAEEKVVHGLNYKTRSYRIIEVISRLIHGKE